MNKKDFIDIVMSKTGLARKDAEAAVNAYHETVVQAVEAGNPVQFVGFGTYQTTYRKAKTGKVPGTQRTVETPAKMVFKFKAGKLLTEAAMKTALPK